MELDRFSSLLERIYRAALDPNYWGQVVDELTSSFKASSCTLQYRNSKPNELVMLAQTANFDSKALAAYQDHFHARDLYSTEVVRRRLVNRALLGPEIIDDRVFYQSEYIADWCRPLGIHYLTGSILEVSPNEQFVIGVHRDGGQPAFDAAHTRLIEMLMPHLRNATLTWRRVARLEIERRAMLKVLDSLNIGVMALDKKRAIPFANRRAEGFLSGDGLGLQHGRVVAKWADEDARLGHLIAVACATAAGRDQEPGGQLAVQRREQAPLMLLVMPLHPHGVSGLTHQPAALIFLSDGSNRSGSRARVLHHYFGLTGAESALVEALIAGLTPAEYAKESGVSDHTVKSHLRQVFQKLDVHRQSDIPRRVLGNPVVRMAMNLTRLDDALPAPKGKG